jgi:hypothetical protein
MHYQKQATTDKQLTQLHIIAKKLQIKGPSLPKNTTTSKEDPDEEKITWYESVEDEESEISSQAPSQVPSERPYSYYLQEAPINELSSYISKNTTRNSLSYSHYRTLKQRKAVLQEEKLLSEGSLEELISAYKVNKSPKYKNRIMLLMKEKQKQK